MMEGASRFSHLLLDEGELLVHDYDCTLFLTPPNSKFPRRVGGRIYLCTRSLIVDSEEWDFPVDKFMYKDFREIKEFEGGIASRHYTVNDNVFSLVTAGRVECKQHGKSVPFTFCKEETKRQIQLHKPLGSFLTLVGKFRDLQERLPEHKADMRAQWIVEDMQRETQFDQNALSVGEHVLLQLTVRCVEPMLESNGLLVITNLALHFQEFSKLCNFACPVLLLQDITRVLPRRHSLRDIGLEIFFTATNTTNNNNNSSNPSPLLPARSSNHNSSDLNGQQQNTNRLATTSVLYSFQNPKQRNNAYQCLLSVPGLSKQLQDSSANSTSNMTLKWMNGSLSNFDYLVYLNSIADRTMRDMTQYPVFPWVLSDYESETIDLEDPNVYRDLSKPVGALNPERLQLFRERFQQMETEPKFMYGTHYSTPGFVLYWLVRTMPDYMLKMQHGRFDVADRLFVSVARSWKSAYTNMADVKELIPQFYTPEDSGFLRNSMNLELGTTTHTNEVVGDVQLPPWARNDPAIFIQTLRNALESSHVSRSLHKWIDLIFGCKQRGEMAANNDNLFYHLTYEGAVDVEAETDPLMRRALLRQIQEFGQTPKQLFLEPHPAKFLPVPAVGLSASPHPSHHLHVTNSDSDIQLASDDTFQSPTTTTAASTAYSSTASSGLHFPPPTTTVGAAQNVGTAGTTTAATGGNVGFEWGVEELGLVGPQTAQHVVSRIHRSAVSELVCSPDYSKVYSVGQDGLLKLHNLPEGKQTRSFNISSLALSSLCLSPTQNEVIVGSWDNHIYTFSIDYGRVCHKLQGHDAAVSCLRLDQNVSLLASGSWDSTVKVWKLTPTGFSLTPLHDFYDCDTDISCLDAQLYRGLCLAGSEDGCVYTFDIRSNKCVHKLQPHRQAISAMSMSTCGRRVVTCSNDGFVKVLEIGGGELQSINLGHALSSLRFDGLSSVIAGGKNGTLTALHLTSGADITELWTQAIHTSAVTSIAVTPPHTISDSLLVLSGSEEGSLSVLSHGEENNHHSQQHHQSSGQNHLTGFDLNNEAGRTNSSLVGGMQRAKIVDDSDGESAWEKASTSSSVGGRGSSDTKQRRATQGRGSIETGKDPKDKDGKNGKDGRKTSSTLPAVVVVKGVSSWDDFA